MKRLYLFVRAFLLYLTVLSSILLYILVNGTLLNYLGQTLLPRHGVQIQKIEGNAFDTLTLYEIQYNRRKIAKRIHIDWSPLERTIHKLYIDELDAKELKNALETPQTKPPSTKPNPKPPSVPNFTVEHLRITTKPTKEVAQMRIDANLTNQNNTLKATLHSAMANASMMLKGANGSFEIENGRIWSIDWRKINDALFACDILNRDNHKLLGAVLPAQSRGDVAFSNKGLFYIDGTLWLGVGDVDFSLTLSDANATFKNLKLNDINISKIVALSKMRFKPTHSTNPTKSNKAFGVFIASLEANAIEYEALPFVLKGAHVKAKGLRIDGGGVYGDDIAIEAESNFATLRSHKARAVGERLEAIVWVRSDYENLRELTTLGVDGDANASVVLDMDGVRSGFEFRGIDVAGERVDAQNWLFYDFNTLELFVDSNLSNRYARATHRLYLPKEYPHKPLQGKGALLSSYESVEELLFEYEESHKGLTGQMANRFWSVGFGSKVYDFMDIDVRSKEPLEWGDVDLHARLDLGDINASRLRGAIRAPQVDIAIDSVLNPLSFRIEHLEGANVAPLDVWVFDFERFEANASHIKAQGDLKEVRIDLMDSNMTLRRKANRVDLEGYLYMQDVNRVVDLGFDGELAIRGTLDLEHLTFRGDAQMKWLLYEYAKYQYAFIEDIYAKFSGDAKSLNLHEYHLRAYEQYLFSRRDSRLRFEDERLVIERFFINDEANVRGVVAGDEAHVALKADRMHLESKEGNITLDGHIDMNMSKEALWVEGDVDVGGVVNYEYKEQKVINDEDIVMLSGEPKKPERVRHINVRIGAKEPLIYRTPKMEVYVVPDLIIWQAPSEELQLLNTLKITKGSYALTDRKRVVLKSSEVLFGGDMLNPYLNVRAVHTTQERVRIQISVMGTLEDPILLLSSTPSMSRNDIIAKLLFNATTQEMNAKGGENDLPLLLGATLAQSISGSLGLKLDRVSLTQTGTGKIGFEVGKRINEDLMLIYKQDDISKMILKYRFNERFESDVSFSTDKNAIDFYYTKEY